MAPRSCYLREDSTDLCLSGKSPTLLSSPICKNIPLLIVPKSPAYSAPFHPLRGAYRDRHGRGVGAVDADGALTNAREADGKDVWS
jgi:hypothetical protein